MIELLPPGGGQNGDVPRLNAAASDMPEGAVRVHRALATTSRLEVVRFLLQNPGSTIGAIIEATELLRPTVRNTLVELEDIGYLVAAGERGHRSGQTLAYSIDRKALTTDLGVYQIYVLT